MNLKLNFNLDQLRRGPKTTGKFVAVDFDSRRLRLVEVLYRRTGYALTGLHSASMPEGLDMDSPEAIGAFLGQVLREHNLSSSRLLMCVPRGQAVLKNLPLPANATRDEIPGMVQFQISKELPFAVEEAVADFTIADPGGLAAEPAAAEPGQNILTAAIRLPMVDRCRKIAEVAGGKLFRLDLRPHANLRCVGHCVQRGPTERIVVVNITAEETEIDVLVGDTLDFSRSAVLRVPSGPEMASRGAEVVRSIVLEVMRSLQSYATASRAGKPDGALVAGDTGLEAAVAEALGRSMQVRCERFDPSGALSLGGGESTSGYIAALGLAITMPAAVESSFNFANPKRPPVKRDKRKTMMAAAAAAAAIVVLGAIVAGASYVGGKKKIATDLARDLQELQDQNTKLKPVKAAAEAVAEWKKDQVPWLDHVAALTSLMPGADEAYLTSLETGYSTVKSSGNATKQRGVLKFVAAARDQDQLDQLERDLRDLKDYEVFPNKPSKLLRDAWERGFTWQAMFEVRVLPNKNVELASMPQPAQRPADDVSANGPPGGSGGSRTRGASGSPRPAAPPRTPTPAPAIPPGPPPPRNTDNDEVAQPVPAPGNQPVPVREPGSGSSGGRSGRGSSGRSGAGSDANPGGTEDRRIKR